jgi:uncharacterized protein
LTGRSSSPPAGATAGSSWEATWLEIDDPGRPEAETRPIAVFREALAKGAALCARFEGAFEGDDGIYIVSTNGGEARAGQVNYRPTDDGSGVLTLVFESPSREVLDAPDNICLSPRGGIVLCEDGGDQYVRGLDREGRILGLVHHPAVGESGPGEFAGACFSPNGHVLFFNVQGGRYLDSDEASGTYAMWGPWEEGAV